MKRYALAGHPVGQGGAMAGAAEPCTLATQHAHAAVLHTPRVPARTQPRLLLAAIVTIDLQLFSLHIFYITSKFM